MKYLKISLCAVMLAVTIVAIIVIPVTNKSQIKEYQKIVLKEYNGHMGIFYGDEMIEEITGVVVANLPATDRFQLKEGIEFKSIDEAVIAAEDYDG